MSTEPGFEVFLDNLRTQVYDQCLQTSDEDPDRVSMVFREEAFTEVVKAILEDLGQITDGEVCFFERKIGRGLARCNGWHYDEVDCRLDLITTVYRGNIVPGGVGRTELKTTIERAIRVFRGARKGYHDQMEAASAAFDMMQRLHQVHAGVERIRVIVLVDGLAAAPPRLEMPSSDPELQVEVWDLRRLFRVGSSGQAFEALEIDIGERTGAPLACLPMPGRAPDYHVLLAVIPGDLLASLYHEFGGRLLELNVRSFLQARGKVNRGIRDTLHEEPSRFLAYNNGISATAQKVDVVPGSDGCFAIRRMTGFQIVNGGQTVASIHRAFYRDRVDLSSVFVQAKITIVQPHNIESLVPKISRYANTQNRVNEADFSANHPYHVRLQKLSEKIWIPGEQSRWFYERARGQYEVARSREATTLARKRKFDENTPKKQKFEKILLAKCVNAWDQLPHVVSRGGQKNFVHFMERLAQRSYSFEPDADYYRRLISRLIIFKHAESLARKHGFRAYRANAVVYSVALLSYRTAGRIDLGEIWNGQGISEVLSETLRDWMSQVHEEIVESAEGLNVTEWCKKLECWRHLRTLDVRVPVELVKELAEGQPLPTVGAESGKKGRGLTVQDRENIARVMQVSGNDWIRIVEWGSTSGLLENWQLTIATTLAGYAAARWTTVPSKKQAYRGVEILAIVDREEGPMATPGDSVPPQGLA